MEYAYATLILNETDSEINERNLTAVLEAAGADVIESRAKAFVAAMEGVDLDEAVDTPDTATVLDGAQSTTSVGTGTELPADGSEGAPSTAEDTESAADADTDSAAEGDAASTDTDGEVFGATLDEAEGS